MTTEYLSLELLFAGILGVAVGGCSGSGNGVAGTGGTTGGVQPSGGAAAGGASGPSMTGGSGQSETGGALGAGGSTGQSETGGALGTGGSTRQSEMGGMPGTGGSTGQLVTGGAAATGAKAATGGVVATGGKAATGGAAVTGGANATGGAIPTGGTKAAGGTSLTGGASSTGGGSSSVCPSPALKSGDTTKKITVGTLSREYILHVPSAYTGSAAIPLVVDFHPFGNTDSGWRSQSPYPAVIDKEGVISAYPQGEPSPTGGAMSGTAWNVGPCCVAPINGQPVDDVAFAKAIVADVEKVACIDPKRVYAVGYSMGGGMSHWLACNAADTFAATGPASFDLLKENEDDCKPSRPIPVIMWRGKQDNVAFFNGGLSQEVQGMSITFLGATACFQKWASLDGCTGDPSAADSNNCQTYSQCSAGVGVTLCVDNNGAHEAANATIVWPMLKQYTMP